MTIQSTNPATKTVVKTFEEMSESAVDQAIATSVETFAIWEKIPFSKRAVLLQHKVGLLGTKKKTPLNFPFYLTARFAAPNTMMVSTIFIKYASIVPHAP